MLGAVEPIWPSTTCGSSRTIPPHPSTPTSRWLGSWRGDIGRRRCRDRAQRRAHRQRSTSRRVRGVRRTAPGCGRGCSPSAASFDRAASDAAELLDLSTRHGFDSWTMIGDDAAGGDRRDCARCVGSRRRPQRRTHAAALGGLVGCGRRSSSASSSPYLPHDDRRGPRCGRRQRGGAEPLRGGARDSAIAPACASTTPRRHGASPIWLTTTSRTDAQLRSALEIAQAQGARPFELRIALDLHELGTVRTRPLT